MRTTASIVCALWCYLAGSSAHAGVLLEDHFAAARLDHRDLSAARGVWKIADGMATCTQEDALYRKNKNHGPVIWYDVSFTNATVRFAFRPQQVTNFVFTLNNEKGHVFRFVQTTTGLSVRAWPVQGHEAKAKALLTPTPKTPGLTEGQWTEAVLVFEGNRCTLSLGSNFKQTFENPAVGFSKTKLGLGFSFGTVSVRDVKIEIPEP